MLKQKDTLQSASIQGWAVLSHIERPDGAMVMRDTVDHVIKGVRYQILSTENSQTEARLHDFCFEGWCYKARGAVEHRSFLRFTLKDRFSMGLVVSDYLTDLKIMNKSYQPDESLAFAVLKCSADIIGHINQNQHFDISGLLQRYDLFNGDIFMQSLPHQKNSILESVRK